VRGAIGNHQNYFHDATCRVIRIRAREGDALAFDPVYNLVVGSLAPAGWRSSPLAAVADLACCRSMSLEPSSSRTLG
jgi:hypothetical protein